jgi:carbon monoxide dehydrogenase subunit G
VANITQSVFIAAPIEVVWKEAANLPSHVEWMADAESIEFLSDLRAGVGVRMKVETAVGPLHTSDLMEVIEWVEKRTIGVRHTGLVRGSGRFELAPVAGGTRFTWTERLTFPWYLGGALTAIFAKPVLGWIWRRNLRGLKARIERSEQG